MSPTATLCADIARTLQHSTARGPGSASVAEWATLAGDPVNASRSGHPSHFTASALPLTPDGKRVCLVLHGRIGLWVQPGGHFEGSDRTVVEAAGRELREETGLAGTIHPGPVRLSRHRAPCRPNAWHLDLQMVALMTESQPTVSSESQAVAWFDVDQLPPDLAPGVEGLVEAAVAHLNRSGSR